MENYKVVRPGHLNHYGYLFGGEMLKWVDEISWIAASREYPGCKFVTVSMDKVEFHRSVRQGALLRFEVSRYRTGNSSVQYTVDVFSDDLDTGEEHSVFSTHVTFVCLDSQGNKSVLPAFEVAPGEASM
jgi:acyl-CoA hydrolase